jgi:lysozyme family protein
MANFVEAYKNTGGHEGGWTVDNGGQTYQGISRKGWPGWEGWRLIDGYIKSNGQPKKRSFFNHPGINNLVPVFYKKNYWDKISGDAIQNQTIANFIYDFYVNSNSALMQINNALGARGGTTINESSLKIINERPGFAYTVIYNVRKNHIAKLSAKKSLKKYAEGWASRLNSFPKQLANVVAGIS